MARPGTMRLGVILGLAPLLLHGCSSRPLAEAPNCRDGNDNCPPGWGCGPDGECVFVGSGGFGGSFGGGGNAGFANGGSFGGSAGSAAFGGNGAFGGGAAFGGSGGSGGVQTVTLGGRCEFDWECVPGLGCMRGDSGLIDAASPALGLCTKSCAANPSACDAFGGECWQVTSGVAYCVESCAFGPAGAESFDPAKCHGRPEMACSPFGSNQAACLPRCNRATDCNVGWSCDPRDGLCRQEQPTGLPLGAPCDESADACLGVCESEACEEACTFGAPLACGRTSTAEPADAYCLHGDDEIPLGSGPGAGDLGMCVPLCDCDDDCPSPLVCLSFGGSPLAAQTLREGFCGTGSPSLGPCN